ncbi:MAG: hypothetical protein ACYDA8_21515, partial [Deferrisomatales bacterium]
FLTSQECSARHRVETTPVTERVSRLRSTPELGLEHADVVTFTHHHVLGASNQYRELFGCGVQIHRLDAGRYLCRGFPFDRWFEADFAEDGRMRLNPFGPAEATRDGARRLLARPEGKDLRWVCGSYRTVDAYERGAGNCKSSWPRAADEAPPGHPRRPSGRPSASAAARKAAYSRSRPTT